MVAAMRERQRRLSPWLLLISLLLQVLYIGGIPGVVSAAFTGPVIAAARNGPLRIAPFGDKATLLSAAMYRRLGMSTKDTSPGQKDPGFGNVFRLRSENGYMEVGIQMAQLLMDARRHDQLLRRIQHDYPWVPESLIVASIDITATAFREVAPEQLQRALRPGGMDRVRPELEKDLVTDVLEQSAIQDLPVLQEQEKRKLVQSVVGMALDYILKDAQEILTAPEIRLEALEAQVKEVKSLMGPWRILIYRCRHANPKTVVAVAALSLATVALYMERQVPLVAGALEIGVSVWQRLAALGSWLVGKVAVTLGFMGARVSSIFLRH